MQCAAVPFHNGPADGQTETGDAQSPPGSASMREGFEKASGQLRVDARPVVRHPQGQKALPFQLRAYRDRAALRHGAQGIGHKVGKHPGKTLLIQEHRRKTRRNVATQGHARLAGRRFKGLQPARQAVPQIQRRGSQLQSVRAHAGDIQKLGRHSAQTRGILPHGRHQGGQIRVRRAFRPSGQQISGQPQRLHRRFQFVGNPIHHFRAQGVAPLLFRDFSEQKNLPQGLLRPGHGTRPPARLLHHPPPGREPALAPRAARVARLLRIGEGDVPAAGQTTVQNGAQGQIVGSRA